MHAIGHQIGARKKHSKVLYITSERFTNDFIDAIQNGTLVKFRRRYRQADVLLIDDIQFLAGKERSQEEFFHTFNALFDGHKQIVLSSDRPPAEIQTLETRLVSRFEWGLTAELLAPDNETRVAILRKKAQSMSIAIDNPTLEFLANRIRTNVRRLEGALMRVASYASLTGHMPTPAGRSAPGRHHRPNQDPHRRAFRCAPPRHDQQTPPGQHRLSETSRDVLLARAHQVFPLRDR
jgi:chromosomal replication initiator protein